MHNELDEGCGEGENDQNNANNKVEPVTSSNGSNEISDETDSDMDSVKCACCDQSYSTLGTHTCRVQCTIEHHQLHRSSSNETLVASDLSPIKHATRPVPPIPEPMLTAVSVTCVLCDEKCDQYDDYVIHLNKCTNNVKLHHFVCPVCHEMHSNKLAFLDHLKSLHFNIETPEPAGVDCVDFAPTLEKTRKPKAVRRQIGWSIEDIYQEIDCKKVEEKYSPPSSVYFDKETPTSSPLKNFFSKLGNE